MATNNSPHIALSLEVLTSQVQEGHRATICITVELLVKGKTIQHILLIVSTAASPTGLQSP